MNRPTRIEPRTLKGFRDYLPATAIPRERIMEIARRVYRSYGFSPIDTPALEYLEILTGKGSDETDKQLYRFQDPGERWVGMRFDLTVPLARFVAQHANELGMPFKRYHIATVWRGENTQHGRYREFMQCDFDTIGTQGIASDIETVLVMHDLLRAIGFEDFTIHINNRQVLRGLLERAGLTEQSVAVLRAIDKLAKIGPQKVVEEIVATAGASETQARQVVQMAELQGENERVLAELAPLVAGSETGQAGAARLAELLHATQAAGLPARRLKLDVSIARGLDYYTGVVFETFLDRLPKLGSVCSGGRYDNLAELYTSQQLPGVGASLGLDRLLAGMEELGMIEQVSTPAEIFIPLFDAKLLEHYLALAAQVRRAGFGVELYPEAKKLGQQLKYADRRGFSVAIIIGENELADNVCQVKLLSTGETATASLADGAKQLVAELHRLLTSEKK
ncbi:MAG TPA: histidine--tRNA ligase [Pirellulales bacterium]|nr:histidine--tRNA ligase [Pirellulales bacterium]